MIRRGTFMTASVVRLARVPVTVAPLFQGRRCGLSAINKLSAGRGRPLRVRAIATLHGSAGNCIAGRGLLHCGARRQGGRLQHGLTFAHFPDRIQA